MPPVVSLALAFALGIILGAGGGSALIPTAVLCALLLVPTVLWRRAPAAAAIAATLVAGCLSFHAAERRLERACGAPFPDRGTFDAAGWFEAHQGPGGGAVAFHLVNGLPGGCRARIRAIPSSSGGAVHPGEAGVWRAEWRASPSTGAGARSPSGTLILGSVISEPSAVPRAPFLVRARGRTQATIARRFGDLAGLVDALVLARKENLDPTMRENFATAGLAHLLAISGFHVAVLASILYGIGRMVHLTRTHASIVAAVLLWGYIMTIGAPDAALRAATILTMAVAADLYRRKPHAVGVLATTCVALLWMDPFSIMRVGFQLSFAGAWGLVVYTKPCALVLRRFCHRWMSNSVQMAVAAGVAATMATTPLVAWHFGQLPLYGIPATLIAGPLVAVALPGILAVLALDPILPIAAEFLAGGVTLVLGILVRVTGFVAELPMASPWVARGTVFFAVLGGLIAIGIVRRSRIRGFLRPVTIGVGVVASALLAPMVGLEVGRDTLLIAMLDVGQGDAIALRSPQGRWILIDAGPSGPRWDAGARRVVPYLRREGARSLEVLVLTHPDLDHIGGAAAVLRGLPVGAVVDPGLPAGREPYIAVLSLADSLGVPWLRATETMVMELDGVRITVLWPSDVDEGDGGPTAAEDANDASVVLLVEWGSFRAVLTGDAPMAVEERLVGELGRVQLLKIGHHGSKTSTSERFLAGLAPSIALIPVGARNSYGHPDPGVISRLKARGIAILRTDLNGTVEIRAHRGGAFEVMAERGLGR